MLPVALRAADDADHPATPLKLYNDGTQKLREGKLQEAEACLQGAVASQNEKVQPVALYNLGEVRFRQGVEEKKKGPSPARTAEVASTAAETGSDAIKTVDQALASEDMQAMIGAYLQGRGARRELKAATAAVKHAMETSGNVLEKWRRAAGDFKGSYELFPSDTDGKTNAEVVDRCIAKLVDQQQMMMQMMMGLGAQRSELAAKMAQLKKKLPGGGGDQLKGKGGDDDEDEDGTPKKPMEGEEKPGTKDGKEMQLTLEEAARMLDSLKLDGNRKLPMGIKELGKPEDRKGRDW